MEFWIASANIPYEAHSALIVCETEDDAKNAARELQPIWGSRHDYFVTGPHRMGQNLEREAKINLQLLNNGDFVAY